MIINIKNPQIPWRLKYMPYTKHTIYDNKYFETDIADFLYFFQKLYFQTTC